MNLDCYTAIGRQHAACQDYARTGHFQSEGFDLSMLYEGIPPWFIAVADGCSQSPDSDIGARLLILGLEHAILNQAEDIPLAAIMFAKDLADQAGLDPGAALDATLLYAYPQEAEVLVVVHGDGVVAARRRDGTVTHTIVSCPLNAPDYLSYYLDLDRKRRYETKLSEFNDAEGRGLKTYTSYEGDRITSTMQLPPFAPVTLAYPTAEFDLVALMSDGAQSFMRDTQSVPFRVPTHEVVNHLMAVQNTTGEFVVRRVRNGFLSRFCSKEGWHHYDDLSMAAVALGDPNG